MQTESNLDGRFCKRKMKVTSHLIFESFGNRNEGLAPEAECLGNCKVDTKKRRRISVISGSYRDDFLGFLVVVKVLMEQKRRNDHSRDLLICGTRFLTFAINRFSAVEETYELPDGQKINIDKERFKAPECLFRPSLIGMEGTGMLLKLGRE